MKKSNSGILIKTQALLGVYNVRAHKFWRLYPKKNHDNIDMWYIKIGVFGVEKSNAGIKNEIHEL